MGIVEQEYIQPQQAVHLASERDWRASLLLHRQVINTRTVEVIGSVVDVVFRPDTCRLAAIALVGPEEERAVSSVARRMLGGNPRNLVYIPVERIVALNDDVVTVDYDLAHPPAGGPFARLPHLSQIDHLPVVTLHGMRLGKMVDVLLDYRGGTITGYLITPTRRGAAVTLRPDASFDLRQNDAGTLPSDVYEGAQGPSTEESEEYPEEAGARPPSLSEPLPSALRIIPASPRVRVGRALILVVEDVEPLLAEDVVIGKAAGWPAGVVDGKQAGGTSADGRANMAAPPRTDELVSEPAGWHTASVPDDDAELDEDTPTGRISH